MESIGQRFKAARERKRVSLSQAAAKTRVKVQVLEAMERDDFSKIPAPTYARGFIRMYAEFLGLDGGPLLKEYAELGSAPKQKPTPKEAPRSEPKSEPKAEKEGEKPSEIRQAVSVAGWRRAAVLVGGLVVIVIVATFASRGPAAREPGKPEAPPHPKRDKSAIVAEPAEPYINVGATNPP